jgi:hypothetical protein
VVSSGDGGRDSTRPATHLGRSKVCRRGWRGASTVNGQHKLPVLVASMRVRVWRLLIGVVVHSDRAPPDQLSATALKQMLSEANNF